MTKYIIAIIGAGAILTLAFVFGSPKSTEEVVVPENNSAASVLSLPEKSFDFGKISMKEGTVSHIFTISNTADSAVEIKNISTSCMCTEAFLINGEKREGPFGMPGHGGGATRVSAQIPAGESRDIEAVFDPAAHGPAGVGRISRAIFIEDKEGRVETLEISATVTP